MLGIMVHPDICRWSDGRDFPDLPDSPTALSLNAFSEAMGLPPTPKKPFNDAAAGQLTNSECSTQLPWHISQARVMGSSPQVSGVPLPGTPPAGPASSMAISHVQTTSAGANLQCSRFSNNDDIIIIINVII